MCNATITCYAKIAMCNATITCNAMLSGQIYFVACVSKWNVRNVKQCWSLVWSVPQLFHNISRTQPWDLPLYLASFAALLCIVTCQLSFLIGISCFFFMFVSVFLVFCNVSVVSSHGWQRQERTLLWSTMGGSGAWDSPIGGCLLLTGALRQHQRQHQHQHL